MNRQLFFRIIIPLLTYICYGLSALACLMLLSLILLLIGGESIQNSIPISIPLIAIIAILLISILLIACFIYIAILLKKLLLNFQKGNIFSTENIAYTKSIIGVLIFWTSCQLVTALAFRFLQISHVSDLYDFSLHDYFINGVLISCALLGKIILEKGLLVQTENDEII